MTLHHVMTNSKQTQTEQTVTIPIRSVHLSDIIPLARYSICYQ